MRDLSTYITEKIASLSKNETGIVVFDIDDTLLRANPDSVKIYKKDPSTGKEVALSTAEFANDPDAGTHKDWFDYRDFYEPQKVYQSIVTGTPILRNLKLMDAYIRAGYKFCFLTARGCEETIKTALKDFLMYKDESGELKRLEDKFKEQFSAAINDKYVEYPGDTDAEKKANVLKKLCKAYDRVIFVDDDDKNIRQARALGLPNLKTIKAQK